MKEILEKIEEAQDLASKDPRGFDFNIRAGMEMKINQAKRDLPVLMRQLEQQVFPGVLVGVFGSGDQEKLNALSTFLEKNKAVVFDADSIYNEMVDEMLPTINKNNPIFGVTQFNILIRNFRALALSFNLRDVEAPVIESAPVPTRQELLEHCKHLVRTAVQDSFLELALRNHVVKTIVESKVNGNKVPVLILNATIDEQRSLKNLFQKTINHKFEKDFAVNKPNFSKLLKDS